MYSRVGLENLRGVQALSIDGLRRINLVVGQNNAGKTTLLEGLFLLGGATNPVFATTLGQLRGQRLGKTYPDAVWRPLFFNLDPHRVVKVTGQWNDEPDVRMLQIEALRVTSYADALETSPRGGAGMAAVTQEFVIGGLRLRYTSADGDEMTTTAMFDPKRGNIEAASKERDDFVRTTFLSARAYSSMVHDAQQFSYLLKIKREQDVLDAVQILDPRVQRIEVLSEPGGPAVYVDLGLPALVPLAVCGEGFVRLFSIIVELTASRGGILLVDEIDNGLHHSVMQSMWTLLAELAVRHNVQIFGTTHNEDIIRSALSAFADDASNLGIFRIDRRPTGHRVAAYNEDAMQAVREEHFEVRG